MRMAVVAAEEAGAEKRFELAYPATDGTQQRQGLPQCWNQRFEAAPAVRKLASCKGQKKFTGARWTATTVGHVGSSRGLSATT
jgi:hypothetical protein